MSGPEESEDKGFAGKSFVRPFWFTKTMDLDFGKPSMKKRVLHGVGPSENSLLLIHFAAMPLTVERVGREPAAMS